MIFFFLGIATIAYVAQMIWLRVGLDRADTAPAVNGAEPDVSIIVAARDEEEFIGECLTSLRRLDYPSSKLEIIIVNDGSTDRTADIAQTFASAHPFVRVITSKPGTENLRGKTNAVAQGIALARGSILMFTDADCVVPPSWVRSTVGRFGEGVGIVGGFTTLGVTSSFEGIQALDWLFLFSVSSSMAGWKMPLTVIGNNLSVRRLAYDAVGGFANIPFSVTEDYALVRAILTHTEYTVAFPLDRDALVVSKACRTVRQLYRQKQRWGVGGLDMIFRGFLITAVGWLLRILQIVTLMNSNMVLFVISFLLLLIADALFLSKGMQRFSLLRIMKYFLYFELYFSFYVILLPAVAILSKNVVWKERKL